MVSRSYSLSVKENLLVYDLRVSCPERLLNGKQVIDPSVILSSNKIFNLNICTTLPKNPSMHKMTNVL